MKKGILSCIFIGLMSCVWAADVGFHAGVKSSQLYFVARDSDNDDAAESINNQAQTFVGYHFGIDFKHHFNDIIAIKPGIDFEGRGIQYKGGNNFFNDELDMRYAVMAIPVHLQLGAPLGTNSAIYGFIGPSFNVNLAGTVRKSEELFGVESEDNAAMRFGESEDDHLRRTEISAQAGIGAMIHGFTLNFAYDLGLTDVFPGDNDADRDFRTRTGGFKFTLGYTLP